MINTPNANRVHIALFGRRNAGKSSLINALTGQNIALVSNNPGTTTDPVYKAMELLPIGPVVFIDTAGLDDIGTLGDLRVKKTKEVMDKTDLAILVFDINSENFDLELTWLNELSSRKIPVIGVLNKCDLSAEATKSLMIKLLQSFNIPLINISAKSNTNIDRLKTLIQQNVPDNYEKDFIVSDILNPKDLVILVAPQDIQAPKGRLILPQVQTLRDVLDIGAMALTVKDTELEDLLKSLNRKPDLVITDSQVFKKVNKILDSDIPLTSFSILMARYKGDLDILKSGAKAIDSLKPGDKVLIAEACTHHPLKGDIGREKLPNWLKEKVGGELDITVAAGVDFPDDLDKYKLIVHCGSCMFNRKHFMTRLLKAKELGIPITNYGTAIAHLNGILEKTTKVFDE